MTVGEKYRELLKIRKDIKEIDYDNNPIIKEMIDVLSNDIKDTINYLKNDCTAEEFIFVSELFDEIVEKTQSKEFIDCLYEVANKYPNETKKYNIINFIDNCKEYLDNE